MNTRVFVTSLATAAALGLALNTHAETSAAHAAPSHPMHPAAVRWIERDAATQSRIAADLGRGRLAPQAVAALETRAADVYRRDAQVLLAPADRAASLRVARMEGDLTRTVAQAEHEQEALRTANRLDRMHARVATWRNAEQQRWIAQDLRDARLNLGQAAALEHEQARIATMQARLERSGHETVDEALRIQHLQDVQDWAIRTAHVTPLPTTA
jgi:hypothetical protein